MAPNVYLFFDYSHKINKFIFFLIILEGWKIANRVIAGQIAFFELCKDHKVGHFTEK